jgi:hypothetical protein
MSGEIERCFVTLAGEALQRRNPDRMSLKGYLLEIVSLSLRNPSLWPPAQIGGGLILRNCSALAGPQPHLESPQDKQVIQPSIMMTAAVLHLAQSWAPSG